MGVGVTRQWEIVTLYKHIVGGRSESELGGVGQQKGVDEGV